MKTTPLKFIVVMFALAVINGCSQNGSIELTNDRSTNHKIVIANNASVWDSLAAAELQKYIKDVSGAKLEIIDDSSPAGHYEIVLGINKHSTDIDTAGIKYDGFRIKTDSTNLYLVGKEGKGTLNAVYSFIEKYLNCRMYSRNDIVVPEQSIINIPGNINYIDNPAFAYRDLHSYQTFDDDYSRWHKLVDSEDKKVWGMFVHTFNQLLPPDKYFKRHPEYYAFRDGVRKPEQLCLSNPDVYDIVVNDLEKRMAENPEAQIWSVSQNDNYSYCQCPECSKIDSIEGSPSGSILNFVNKVARRFPDKTISTLAYQYSRKAPAHIKPEENVNIMLCTIECFRTKPIAEDSSNAGFVKDITDWSKLTDNIYLWDYVVQFTNLISPFPNFQVLQPNIQLFHDYHVSMMFQQAEGERNAAEFGELRSYIIAKLLWNPGLDIDSLMNEFLSGYYGNAGTHLKEYINLMKNELLKSGYELNIYGDPVEEQSSYLSPELMTRYNKIFDEAEESVKDQPEYLKRVKIARLPLTYAALEQAKVNSDTTQGIVIKNGNNEYIPNPATVAMLDELLEQTKDIKNVYLNEKGLTPGTYVERYKRMLSKTMKNPLGLYKQVEFITQPNLKYPANGEKSLTDGRRGNEDHHYNWLGFEGNDMEVVINLGRMDTVKKVSADFIQNSFSWIFLPEKFEVSISKDGKAFKKAGEVTNTTPITKEETASPENAFIQNFSCLFSPLEAAYVKVKAVNMGTCPRWHPGYPFKAWIFTDEIVIE